MSYPYSTTPYNSCNQAAVQQGAYPDALAAPSRLAVIADHLESVNSEISVALDRFVRLADRLNGAQPQEVAKDQGLRGAGGGLTTLIETHLEQSGALINRLHNVLERLETL